MGYGAYTLHTLNHTRDSCLFALYWNLCAIRLHKFHWADHARDPLGRSSPQHRPPGCTTGIIIWTRFQGPGPLFLDLRSQFPKRAGKYGVCTLQKYSELQPFKASFILLTSDAILWNSEYAWVIFHNTDYLKKHLLIRRIFQISSHNIIPDCIIYI